MSVAAAAASSSPVYDSSHSTSPSFLLHTRNQQGTIHCIAFCPLGKLMVTTSDGRAVEGDNIEPTADNITVRDAVYGREILKLRGPTTSSGFRIIRVPATFTHNGEFIVTLNSNFKKKKNQFFDVVVLYETRSGNFTRVHEFEERHQREIVDVSVSCDDRYIAACSLDGKFSIYSMKNREILHVVKPTGESDGLALHRVNFCPTIANLIIVGGKFLYFDIYKVGEEKQQQVEQEEEAAENEKEEKHDDEQEEDVEIEFIKRLPRYDPDYYNESTSSYFPLSSYSYIVQNSLFNNIVWSRNREGDIIFTFMSPHGLQEDETNYSYVNSGARIGLRYYICDRRLLNKNSITSDPMKKMSPEHLLFTLCQLDFKASDLFNFALTNCGSLLCIGGSSKFPLKTSSDFEQSFFPLTVVDVATSKVVEHFYFHAKPITAVEIDPLGVGTLITGSKEIDYNSLMLWQSPTTFRWTNSWRKVCLIKYLSSSTSSSSMKSALDVFRIYIKVATFINWIPEKEESRPSYVKITSSSSSASGGEVLTYPRKSGLSDNSWFNSKKN